jgi:hypothetical protein
MILSQLEKTLTLILYANTKEELKSIESWASKNDMLNDDDKAIVKKIVNDIILEWSST